MDLHHLRHFIAVAEELHFGRAATRLNIVQPALTQSIHRLEADLGVKLFTREGRGVGLTRAGAVLLGEAKRTLAQASFAEQSVRRFSRGEVGSLRIGYVEAALFKVMPDAIRRFGLAYPDVALKLELRTTGDQIRMLEEGQLDLGLVQFVDPPDSDLSIRAIDRATIQAAVPSSWPIAKKTAVHMADLATCPFVLFERSIAPDYFDAFVRLCNKADFEPRVAHQVRGLYTFLSFVAAGLGVAMLPSNLKTFEIAGVSWLPLADASPSFTLTLALAWVPRAVPPELEALIDLFATQPSPTGD